MERILENRSGVCKELGILTTYALPSGRVVKAEAHVTTYYVGS